MTTETTLPFFNPEFVGFFTLGKEQVGKVIPFKTTLGVFSNSAKVVFYDDKRTSIGRTLLRTATIGDGLTLTGNNTGGEEKTLTLTLDGGMFTADPSIKRIYAECTFFAEGDIEVILGIIIK